MKLFIVTIRNNANQIVTVIRNEKTVELTCAFWDGPMMDITVRDYSDGSELIPRVRSSRAKFKAE